MKILEQPRFSFWRFRERYQCTVPDHCLNPLEQATRFFQQQGVQDIVAEPDGIRFSRGTVVRGFLSFSERRLKQEVRLRISREDSGRILHCEYQCFHPVPDLHVGQSQLQKEVEQLEVFLGGGATISRRKPGWLKRVLVNLPLRILYRVYRVVSWLRYRSSRRLTPAGSLVLIAVIVAGMTGVDTETTVAYQAFAPLLALLVLAASFSWTFRAQFTASRRLPRFGTVGQAVTYDVVLENRGRKTQSDLVLLENLDDPRPAFAEWRAVQVADEKRMRSFRFGRRRRMHPFRVATFKIAAVPRVRPQESVVASVEMVPLRRGVVHLAGVSLARPDPFGLFRAFCKVPLPQTMLVLPRRYSLPPITLPGTLRYQEGGVALAANVGRSDEFVSLRDYRRGDPLRHIHWRSWAKTGRPIVREFEDEHFVRHALILDTFTADPRSEAFEEAVSVAASFACTIQIQESLLDLLFVGTQAYCFTAGRGLAHADQMLEILASVKVCDDKTFRAIEPLVLDRASSLSGCICVLLAWDRERRDFVQKLRAIGLPVLVLVISDSARDHSLDPGPMKDCPEHFRVLKVDEVEQGLAAL